MAIESTGNNTLLVNIDNNVNTVNTNVSTLVTNQSLQSATLSSISNNINSTLTVSNELNAISSYSSDSTKHVAWRTTSSNGLPYIGRNTGTKDVIIRPLTNLNLGATNLGALVINYASYTNNIVTSSLGTSTINMGNVDGAYFAHINENHKRERVINSLSTSIMSRYATPFQVDTALGSAITFISQNTGSSISVAYSTTTSPIFISYATNTQEQLNQYGSGPLAFNPVYKVVAIAGATSTAATYTGAAGTVPTTTTVFNFDYDYSESVSTNSYGTLNTLASTMTSTLKSTLNVSTNNNTAVGFNTVDIAWSEDGKYLAASIYTNDATASRGRVVVMSMDTSTKVLTSVATATYAAEARNANQSICWSGNSQIWLASAAYSAGNVVGILYNFATVSNTLSTAALPTAFQGNLSSLGTGLGHVDRFDNGHLLVRIGTTNRSSAINIWNPATSSSVIVVNPLTVDSNVTTAQQAKLQMRIGKAYGSASHLHPFVYANVDPTASASSSALYLLYNSQAGTVTSFGRITRSISSTQTGDIGFSYGKEGETVAGIYSTGTPFVSRNLTRQAWSSSSGNFINFNIYNDAVSPFGSISAFQNAAICGSRPVRIRPGEAFVLAPRADSFWATSDNLRAVVVTEVE